MWRGAGEAEEVGECRADCAEAQKRLSCLDLAGGRQRFGCCGGGTGVEKGTGTEESGGRVVKQPVSEGCQRSV